VWWEVRFTEMVLRPSGNVVLVVIGLVVEEFFFGRECMMIHVSLSLLDEWMRVKVEGAQFCVSV